jgi:hypothetical protein
MGTSYSQMHRKSFIQKHGTMADEFTHIGPIGEAVFFLVSFPRLLTGILAIITFSLYTTSMNYDPQKKEQQQQSTNLFYLSLALTIISIVWNIWITGWMEIPQLQRWRSKLFANDAALASYEKYKNALHQEQVQQELSELNYRQRTSPESSLTGALLSAAIR